MSIFHHDQQIIEDRDEGALDLFKKRLIPAMVVIVLFFFLVVFRLWMLQIVDGEEYARRSDDNRVKTRKIAAPRGHILDRFGREIVTNRPSFNVTLIQEDSLDIGELLSRLAPVLEEDVSTLWKKVRNASGVQRHIPIILQEDIDWKTLSYLENHKHEFPGIRTEVQPIRMYHYQDLAANIIGYIGLISHDELKKRDPKIYGRNDIVGKTGLEFLREADLRGEKGYSEAEVNAIGFEQRLLRREEPLSGREIRLTIDVDLQKVAEETMAAEDKAGAVVALEVDTGRVLVAASTPGIHLQDFIGGISGKKWKKLRDNPRKPLVNKVVQFTYPPGSTYKMITALTGLMRGVINEETTFYCPGYYYFGGRRYSCWRKGGHGSVNLERAISESCDVYFYKVGEAAGVDALAETAKKLGLGRKTGIEMISEKAGVVPSKEWKRQVRKSSWQKGDTLSVAIGQGFNLVTPLQICLMTAAIANHGKVYKPQLVEQIVDPDGNLVESFVPKLLSDFEGVDRYFDTIIHGMKMVVQGKRGTARLVAIDGLEIAGKTGTAQVVDVKRYRHLKEKNIPYKWREHAWFTCFAPAENPEIAVTVLVEHGLHGGSAAGPVAKAVLQQYFSGRLNHITPSAGK